MNNFGSIIIIGVVRDGVVDIFLWLLLLFRLLNQWFCNSSNSSIVLIIIIGVILLILIILVVVIATIVVTSRRIRTLSSLSLMMLLLIGLILILILPRRHLLLLQSQLWVLSGIRLRDWQNFVRRSFDERDATALGTHGGKEDEA